MNTALIKDILREIRKSLGRFLSILLIVALGVAFFAGVRASVPDMKYTADAYFDEYNMQDIQLLSTVGFTDEDVEAIRQIDGVEGVHATYSMDAVTTKGSKQITLKVLTMPQVNPDKDDPDYINQVRLVEGRMPQKSGECLMEYARLIESDLEIGDTITLDTGTDDPISDYLNTDTFTIVGSMYTPIYLSYEKGSTTVGSGSIDAFITVLDEDFALDYYTEVDITVSGAKQYNSYDDVYFDVTDPVKSSLETLGLERADLRLDEIKAQATSEYEKGVEAYEESKQEFDEQIKQGEVKLDAAENELIISQATLNSSQLYAQQEIQSGEAQLKTLESLLDSAKEKQQAAVSRIQGEIEELNAQLEELKEQQDEYDAIIVENDKKIEELRKELETADEDEKAAIEAEIEIREQAKESAETTKQYLQTSIDTLQDQLNSLSRQLDETDSYLQELQTMIDEQRQELQAAKQAADEQIDTGQGQIDAGWDELTQGRTELARQKALGEAQLELAQERLDKAKEQIDAIDDPQWYVLDRESQYSYMDYGSVADRMEGIAKVFPVFFFLVAALVCLTTMTRMVDEQRGNIGTMKALGYSKGAIALKYLMYAFIAGVAGSIVGCSLGMWIFPTVIFSAWNLMYNLPELKFVFQPGLMLSASGLVIGVTMAAAFAAVYKELMEVPSQLMRPKTPKVGKKILLERFPSLWSKFSFTWKVTARNIFRYKKRFFMTVIGIAGCSALLVAGFGIQDSISDIVSKQYDEILNYDASISFKNDATMLEKDDFMNQLKNDDRFEEVIGVEQLAVTVDNNGEDSSVTVVVPNDVNEFADFTTLRHRGESDTIALKDDGALISEKLAMNLGLGAGDVITVTDGDGFQREIKIADVVENYVGHYLYMSPSYFKEVFKERQNDTTVLVKTVSTDSDFENELGEELMGEDIVTSVSFYSGLASSFEDTISSLNFIVVVLVISAGLLAFVVLYNLTNVNISERVREIATIKVLGFYDKEVSSYVFRETIFLTIIGALAGLLLGIGLHRLIMSLAEMESVMFGRNIDALSYVISFVITLVFGGIVDLFMYRKLKKVQMVESLKSVE